MVTVKGYKNAQGRFIPTPNKYRPNAHTHPNDREYEQIQIATRTSPNTIKYGLRYVEPVDFSLNATKRRVEASDRFFEPKMYNTPCMNCGKTYPKGQTELKQDVEDIQYKQRESEKKYKDLD